MQAFELSLVIRSGRSPKFNRFGLRSISIREIIRSSYLQRGASILQPH